MHHLAAGMQPLANRNVEILDRGAFELLQCDIERLFREIMALLAERLLQDRLAEIEILLALLGPNVAADARLCLGGDDKPLPGWRWRLCLRGHHLDLIAIRQFGPQRHQTAVDLGAHASIADLGMDGIGEIDGGRAARQLDQIALRREAEDLILIHL